MHTTACILSDIFLILKDQDDEIGHMSATDAMQYFDNNSVTESNEEYFNEYATESNEENDNEYATESNDDYDVAESFTDSFSEEEGLLYLM